MSARIEAIYRAEARRVLATLIRLLGDLDRAEEAAQDAFRAALERWPVDGEPANPTAWLISAGRFQAIDRLRKHARVQLRDVDVDGDRDVAAHAMDPMPAQDLDERHLPDDQLRLVFTCCHPALAPEAQVALTLREVCGLTTEEIAAAYLTPAPTIYQRIVRAKAKIRDERIPYVVPGPAELPARLDSVRRVVYLVFNEGYASSSGDALTRAELSTEAIRLGRLLVELLPDAELLGLLALMLFAEARRATRTTAEGDLVLLADQDRARWDRPLLDEARALVERALQTPGFGAFTLQAAIAAVHAEAATAAATDWGQIIGLYDLLLRAEPSPVVELNRAAALAMRDGPAPALRLVDRLLAGGDLGDYHLAHSTRADLLRRLGRPAEARAAYQRALELTRQDPERRFLERRLRELGATRS